MSGALTIDSSGFQKLVNELSQISGKDYKDVLIAQTAALLKNCIAHTPVADRPGIIKRVSAHSSYVKFQDGTVISHWKKADAWMFLDDSTWRAGSSKRPGKAPTIVKGKSWHQMDGNRHWSNERWARWTAHNAMLERQLRMNKRTDQKAALGARGLAAHSWLQVAEDLAIPFGQLGARGYVQNAVPSNGKTYKNGFAKWMIEGAAAFIEITNNQPTILRLSRPSGARILEMAVQARIKSFGDDMKRGVFDDLKKRAQRYPGIFTT